MHLRNLALLAARGKHRSPDVARFMLDPAPALASLSRALADGSYRPGAGRAFWILDPKPRVIFALPFRDRIAQHALIAATLPALERGFAPQRGADSPLPPLRSSALSAPLLGSGRERGAPAAPSTEVRKAGRR